MNVPALPSFRHGYFEMQDEGSQLVSMLVQATPGSTVVDACAGGGGKTLHLAAMMMNKGNIIAIEVEEYRLRNIHERLRRTGISIVQTCLAGESEGVVMAGGADGVLIDAPCSGVGTFRRNPASKSMFTVDAVESLAKTQAELLDKYSLLVKPGGRLVYSTCTLIKRENEEQVEAFLARHPDFELLSAADILSQQGVKFEAESRYLTLLPHKTTTDGFFGAAMTRRAR
jgi:16S rRNA (cytosine967-C5)-methyltransferase